MRFASYMPVSLITFFFHSYGSIFYHCIYGCMFCMLLFSFVNCVFFVMYSFCYVYVFLLLCMFRSGYCVSLCCLSIVCM